MNQAVILLWVSSTLFGRDRVDVSTEPTWTTRPALASGPTFAYTEATPPPNPSELAALTTWAERHLLRLEPPAPANASSLPAYARAVVRQIEDLLEQARLSAGSLDERLALEQLAQAEALIYEHAELPQAGLLLAEAASQQASIAERHGNGTLAQIQRLRAEALEGPRVRPYADSTEVQVGSNDGSPTIVASTQRIQVRGLAITDTLVWDGNVRGPRRFSTLVGEHHAQVLREGQLIWAGFVMVYKTSTEVNLAVEAPAPCTRSDLVVSVEHERPMPASGVRCPLWALARPAKSAGVDIALCRLDRCGALQHWRVGFGEPLVAPLHEEHPFRLPNWALYVAAGFGAAAATSLVLWQSGAFDDPERTPATWSFGGIGD